jgi:HEPN domain-containing protein
MVRQFVEKAEHDLAAAAILATEASLADVVCFHCQQSVEKMLKAALLAAGVEPPRIHDLGFLLETLEAIRPVPDGLREVCAALADFGVAPRYPGWEAEVGTVDTGDALRAARRGMELLGPLASKKPST